MQQRVARGRVEVAVGVQQRRAPALDVELNEAFLTALGGALERAREQGFVTGALTPGDLLRFPQALAIRERVTETDGDADALGAAGRGGASTAALDELDAMRGTEGGYLRADLDGAARAARRPVRPGGPRRGAGDRRPAGAAARARAASCGADALADETLVAQEIVRFVGRSDITEEVVRFRGHLEHWQALSDGPEPCGRKLDFLLQEMNREVNTIGSKAEGPAVSEIIVSLKAELEKMREQVQNVE